MLDDQNIIQQRDPQNYLSFVAQQPEQLKHVFGIVAEHFARPIENVVFSGMGGSALVAELANSWPLLTKPYVIRKEYTLPEFVGENTLVISSSYSGNTEESLAALAEARRKGAQIAVITHGGKMLDDAREHKYVLAQIPACPQPRVGVFYAYRALVEILEAAWLIPKSSVATLEALVTPLEAHIKEWTAMVSQSNNLAKQLAQKMIGKTPIIYAGPHMYPAAYKWKIDFNENAKNTAWCNMLPEFNHNEFIGWSSHPIEKPFAVVDLFSSFEHPRVQKRFDVSDRLLSGMRPAAIRVEAKGDSILEHLLYLVLLGDFTTIYTAFLNGVNPTPVDLVEKFKKELG